MLKVVALVGIRDTLNMRDNSPAREAKAKVSVAKRSLPEPSEARKPAKRRRSAAKDSVAKRSFP